MLRVLRIKAADGWGSFSPDSLWPLFPVTQDMVQSNSELLSSCLAAAGLPCLLARHGGWLVRGWVLPTRGPHAQGAPEPSEQVARGVLRCQELCNAAPRQRPDLTCAPAKSAGGCGTRRGVHQVWKQGLGLSCPSEMPPLLSGRYKAGGTTSLLLL